MRSRVVQVDTQKIIAARRGREILKLNLFDDAVVEVQIKRVRPTRSGYFISGRPKGMDWGEAQLVVNGRVMVGTVRTPEGTFTIRTDGSGRQVIRQIDSSKEPFKCDVEDAPLPLPSSLPAISSIGPAPSSATLPAIAADVPTEDGSEIRVLFAYTPAAEQEHGGAAGMQALIDLMIQSANQAFEDSGVNPRLVLAHTVRVHHVETNPYAVSLDLHRLRIPDDGYMDEVHTLRNEHAADLVHLVGLGQASGRAYALRSEQLSFERNAFAMTFAPVGNPSEYVFAHEVGHNLGLLHDRYVEQSKRAIYPYGYGYVNKDAFETRAAERTRWRTLMAYNDRCTDARFFGGCEWLLRFSNPGQTYLGDALGIAGEEHVVDPDGPSDARRTINETARLASSFRSEACTDFTVTPENHVVSVAGGRLIVQVNTTAGCLWEISNQPEFLTLTSGARFAGSVSVVIEVEANQGGMERSGTLTVAGHDVQVRQLATTAGVCGRSSSVFQAITSAAGYADAAKCDEVTDSALAGILSLDLRNKRLDSLEPGDFAGMSGLQTLRLNDNELKALPEDIFDGLSSLQELSLNDNEIRALPEDIFDGLSSLRSLNIRGNLLNDVPMGLFDGLSSLQTLVLQNNRLTGVPAGLFSGLSNLQTLELGSNRLTGLPAGLFSDLSSLRTLYLSSNRLEVLPADTFNGLTALQNLTVGGNGFITLPVGLFAGLSELQQLSLNSNRFGALPVGIFDGLGNLQYLSLASNYFDDLPNGLFGGLSGLESLNLENSRISQLPIGIFAGLSSLESLRLNNNLFRDLPMGLFDGLSNLDRLDLRKNRFRFLPDRLFTGLPALPNLYLNGNTVDPLPLPVTLEKVGEDQFKAVASTGAPFALVLPISISGGDAEGNASNVTIPATEQESTPIRVTRQAGTSDAVAVEIGALPDLPNGHQGYALEKGTSGPLEVLQPQAPKDAALTGLSLGSWTLSPAFASDTTQYAAIVDNETSSITVTATRRNAAATLQFLDGNDNELADADAMAEGHQASLSPGPNTIQVMVTSTDGTATRTYTLAITRDGAGGVCGRTKQVREEILRAIRNVDACADVTEEHLSTIGRLDFNSAGLVSLQSGDFAGLSGLVSLLIRRNDLTSLPADIFSGLTSLRTIWLLDNRFETLPADVFSGLTSLQSLLLYRNQLQSLPEGIFSDQASLNNLAISNNRLSSLPEDIFSGLTSLERFDIGSNEIRSLPAGIFTGRTTLKYIILQANPISSFPADLFSGLTSVETLSLYGLYLTELPTGIFSGLTSIRSIGLGGTQLTSIPADTFSGLTTLETLLLHGMGLTSLPDGVFSGLPALESLWLEDNRFSSLQGTIFSGLTSLDRLGLGGNNLASLPENLFSGLTALEDVLLADNQLRSLPPNIFLGLPPLKELQLQANAVSPIPVGVSLEKVGTGQFKAVAPTAVPFAVEIVVAVSSSGEMAGGANTVTIPAGSVESAAVEVSRVAGAVEPVTVDIRGLPNLPVDHQGYLIEAEGALPLEILAAADPQMNAALSSLVLSDGALNPSFGAGVTAYAAKVGNAVSSITVTPAASSANASVAYLDASDQALADADANTDGQQLALDVGENTIKVQVTAEDTTTTLTYTIVVTRNSVPVITTTSPVSVEENAVAVATLSATDADADAIGWSTNGGEDTSLFELTREGELTFTVAPDHENPSDTDTDNEYVVVVRASDGTDTADLALTVTVTDLEEDAPATDDASLASLSLSEGTLSPGFASDTTGYTATVGNAVSSITVTPATSSASASVAYLDASDQALADADANSDGQQVALDAGENSIKVQVTAEDTTTTQTYTIVVTRASATQVTGAICGRSETVWKAIVAVVTGIDECRDVTEAHLSGITSLDLSNAEIASLQSGDFAGLTALEFLWLYSNQLEALPDDLFAGLTALERLNLGDNQLSSLPNGVFTGLTALEELSVYDNELTSLDVKIFSGLTALARLYLSGNQLGEMPAGLLSGLNSLAELNVSGNPVDPLPFAISLEKVGESSFKAVAPIGAPFALDLPVSVSSAGVIAGGADTVTIPTGAVESTPLEIERVSGTQAALTVDLGTLPARPWNHRGYAFEKGADLPLAILTGSGSDDRATSQAAALSNLTLSSGALLPAFASGTTSYTAAVANAVSAITVSPTTSETNATVEYLGASDQELADADSNIDGQQVNLDIGENTIKVRVTAEDPSTVRTYTLAVTRNSLPAITTASPVSVEENETAVATLAATDADNDDVSWSTNGGADEGQFNLTAHGVLTFVSAPDYEASADTDGNNDYVVVVQAYDGTDSTEFTLTVQVTDVSEVDSAAQDASLSDLTLSEGALDSVFLSATTSYTATAGNAVSTVTITPTKSNADATVAYLNASDLTLADADTNTDGHQVNLSVGENTVKIEVTAEDTVTTRTYTIVLTRDGAAGVCVRTSQVRAAIVTAVQGVGVCADVTQTHLSGITSLDLSEQTVSSLESGDFAGLTALAALDLSENRLTSLPEDVFSGLTALETLTLHENRLNRLPAGVFSGLTSLRTLVMTRIRLESLPSGVFAGLTSLQTLELQSNFLESLPSDIFSGLNSLRYLRLYFNQLSSLPDGLFSGLPALADLDLYGNKVDPLLLPVSLEKVADGQFRAVASTGMPFNVDVPVSTSSSGTIDGGASTVRLSAGATASAALNVSRVTGAVDAVTADIGTLPDPPREHSGYVLEKDAFLPREVLPPQPARDAALSGLVVSAGTLVPAFAVTSTNYTVAVENTVSLITVTATRRNVNASIAYLDAADQTLADADANTAGYQVNLNVGGNTIKLKVTSSDGTEVRTYTVVVSRASAGGVCARTKEIADAIVANVAGVEACEDITETHLAEISSLRLDNLDISSVQTGDFDGLSTLSSLDLSENDIGSLPADIFSDLSRLTSLDLSDNELKRLPSGLLSRSRRLQYLHLNGNDLQSLPSGVFSNNADLDVLYLQENDLTGLPSDVFSSLTGLGELDLGYNQLNSLPGSVFAALDGLWNLVLANNELGSLPTGIFSGLSNLSTLDLGHNLLTGLPTEVFSGLEDLERLYLNSNRLNSLPPGVFSELAELETLFLDANQLTTLPPGLFSGLGDLGFLRLRNNQFASLPPGIFSGVNALRFLNLSGNVVDPLPMSVSLEKVGNSQFKAVAPTGVPYDLSLPVSISSAGGIQGNAEEVRILAGSVESAALAVTRLTGTAAAVTVDIGTLPELPNNHSGYALAKAGSLPREILPFDDSANAQLSGLALGGGTLTPAFAPGTTSYTARVSNDVSSVTITPTRSNSNATLTYLDSGDQALEDADSNTEGHQISLSVGENTVKVKVTAVDTTTTRTYTIVISRDSAIPYLPEITTTSPLSVEENQTAIATLQATDRNGDEIVWSTHGGADENHFNLTTDGVLTFATPRDYEAPTDTDRNNEYEVVVAAADRTGATTLTLIVTVTGVDEAEPGMDDASLSRLDLDGGTLNPVFAAGTTSYTVRVSSSVSSIAFSPTTSNEDATVEYLDASDQDLADADTGTDGHQVNLSPGENTIKVKVTAADSATTQTYTVAVTRNRAPVVTTASNLSVEENRMAVTTLAATDAESDEIRWSAKAGEDAIRFYVNANGTVTFRTAPDYEAPNDGDENNDYVLVVQASDGADITEFTLTISVTNVEEASTDASLKGLLLNFGTLDPAFAPGATSYAASVARSVSTITVTATPNDTEATVTYLDANDSELEDADTTARLHQVNLSLGDNTFKVRVTAEDGTTTQIHTIVVTRVEVPAVCDRTTQVRDAIVNSVAAVTDCADITETHLSQITSLTISDRQLTSTKSGDFAGLTGLGNLNLSYSGLARLPADAFSGLTSLTRLNLSHAFLRALPDGVFSGLTSLESLSLSYNNLRSVPEGAFAGLTRLGLLALGNNSNLGALPEGIFDDLTALTRLELGNTALGSLRADTFSSLDRLDLLILTRSGLSSLPSGVFAGLTELEILSLNQNELSSLPQNIFADLTALESLLLSGNGLESVRADAFSGMSKLKFLYLSENELISLPSNVFSGLSRLRALSLYDNVLTSLPRVVFSDLTALEDLRIVQNKLSSLHADTFAGLSKLELLFLASNELTDLPAGIFRDLTELEQLALGNNKLSSLPAGLLSGLTSLESLGLGGNTVDPLPMSVSLQKVGSNQFKAVAPVGAPFDLDLPVSVSSSGEIAGNLNELSISTGGLESSAVAVTRVAGTHAAVTVDIGNLPSLPGGGQQGYSLVKDDSLPLEVLESTTPDTDATLTGLSLSTGTLDPAFATGTTDYAARVANATTSITVTPTKSVANATVAYLDGNDQALADADMNTGGQQVNLSAGENTIKVKVTAEDTTTTQTYTVVVTRNSLPQITTTSPVSVNERSTAVTTLAATDAESDDVTWSKNGGADASLFSLTTAGVLTFASAPDYESPADDDENNDYVVVVRASDGTDTTDLTLTVNVANVDDAALFTDATLSGLSLSSGTLAPVFAYDTTNYTARATNATSLITVTPTKSVADATLAYLDGNDQPLTDANANVDGQQVNLSVGANTFKVKITAEDTTTTQTYTVVVTRNSVPQITTTSPISVEENQTAVTTLAATDADNDAITWSKNGGVDESLFNLTSAGVLTFASAPDYESPDDAGANNEYVIVVRASDGTNPTDLTLTVNVTDVSDVSDGTSSTDATLSDFSLSWGRLSPLFASGITSYRASVGNNFSSITVMPTKSHATATVAYLDENDGALEDADAMAQGQQAALEVGENTIKVKVTAEDQTTTRTYTIVVKRLAANANGVPNIFSPFGYGLIDVDENQTEVVTLKAFDPENEALTWLIDGGEDKDLFTVNANGEVSFINAPDFEAPADADGNNQYEVKVVVRDPNPSGSSRNLTVRVSDVDEGEDLAGNASLSGLSLSSGTLVLDFYSGTTSYTALVANEISTITVTPTKRNSAATLVYLDGSNTEIEDADTDTSGHQVDLDPGANTIRVRVTSEDRNATETYSVVVSRNRTPQITTTSPISVEEHDTSVATLEAIDADNHEKNWSIIGGADEAKFNLTTRGELTFVSEPDFESPADADGNNDYVVMVRVTDTFNSSDLTLTVNVTDIDESQISTDATLSGLSLSSGTLDPVFASGATSYAARVQNGVSSITVTPTRGDSDATLEYLDENDSVLADADGNTEGQQVNLALGENTFKVKVTAEDTTTTQTYTLVVTRNSRPRISTSSPAYVREGNTAVITLAAGDADGDEIAWSKVGGDDQARFNLTSDGVLTFVSAPDYENPADADMNNDYVVEVRASDGLASPQLTLTVNVINLFETDAEDDASLSALAVDGRQLGVFPPGKTRFLRVVSSTVSRVTFEATRSNPNATVTYLDANDSSLSDADSGTNGHQVDVSVGRNPIRLKVTAADDVTTRTYTIIINRNANLPTAADVEIVTESPIYVEENQTAVATLEYTHRDGHAVEWFMSTFLGAVDGTLLDLTDEGVLTFVTAPNFERPGDQDENNEYEVEVFASNGELTRSKRFTIIVTNVDEGELSSDATLSGLSLSDGTLSPAFASGTMDYTASVGNSVSSITFTPTAGDTGADVEYQDVRDDELTDADTSTGGQQVDLSVGKNTIHLEVTAEDGNAARTYTIVVTRGGSGGVCGRTEQVRDEIVYLVSGVDACEDVSASHLSGITALVLQDHNIETLQSGDFSGLTGLASLYLSDNGLGNLPADVFSGLSALARLDLDGNQLDSLPANIFSGLTALTSLSLSDNELTVLPQGIFSGLTKFEYLELRYNSLASLREDVFSGLTALGEINLGENELTSLPAGVFSGLTALGEINLEENELASLPAGVFSGLTNLVDIDLTYNDLSSLPDGLLSGLTSLRFLRLSDNMVDPLPVSVSLEKVGSSQFKAVVPVGATFAMDLPVSVSADGEIDGGADTVALSTGAVESAAVGVSRVSGTSGAVTVDIGAFPGLPTLHYGYEFVKDSSLPLEILAAQSGAPADASYADVNRNGMIEADDAMLMYHAFESAGELGDGETGGTARSRQTLIAGLADARDPGDDELREMLGKANEWREAGVEVGGDINGDGRIDGSDALAMYYAFEFENLVGNGETGGTTRFRRSLLAELAAQANPSDADLKAMLRNAHALRAAAAEAAQ